MSVTWPLTGTRPWHVYQNKDKCSPLCDPTQRGGRFSDSHASPSYNFLMVVCHDSQATSWRHLASRSELICSSQNQTWVEHTTSWWHTGAFEPLSFSLASSHLTVRLPCRRQLTTQKNPRDNQNQRLGLVSSNTFWNVPYYLCSKVFKKSNRAATFCRSHTEEKKEVKWDPL